MTQDTQNPARRADPRRVRDRKSNVRRADNSRRRERKANAYAEAFAFNFAEIYVTNLDGEPVWSDDERQDFFAYFLAREEGDDWPLIHLTATGVIDVAPGARASGRENPEPRHFRRPIPFCLPPALIRCACVLEIEDHAWESFSRQLQTRNMPSEVQWLWDRHGRRQAWFTWPRGWTRDGVGSLPPGVRLIDDRVEAPLKAHLIAKDFWMQELPALPLWLARMAGGRVAETTAECIVNDSPLTREIAVWPEGTDHE